MQFRGMGFSETAKGLTNLAQIDSRRAKINLAASTTRQLERADPEGHRNVRHSQKTYDICMRLGERVTCNHAKFRALCILIAGGASPFPCQRINKSSKRPARNTKPWRQGLALRRMASRKQPLCTCTCTVSFLALWEPKKVSLRHRSST